MLVLLNDGILYFLPRELRPRAKVETPGVEGVKKDPEQGGDKSSELFRYGWVIFKQFRTPPKNFKPGKYISN